jgi:uncharacterized protein Yka (UPF0111/DUF47 family)
VLPIPLPAQGKLGERRAREIKIMRHLTEDPRRAYFRLLHILSIAVPNSAEKIIDEFQMPEGLPEETRKLMAEAIASSLKKLKKIEERLSELEKKLEVDEG